jgi:hypothetical protein
VMVLGTNPEREKRYSFQTPPSTLNQHYLGPWYI